jgi:hypothetical protein
MKRSVRTFLLLLCLLPAQAGAQAYLPMFDTVFDAERHCPYDEVVWIKAQAAFQPHKGQPKKEGGGYVCRQEAVNVGYGGLVTKLQPLNTPGNPR